jgi:hypothetical protein
MRGGFGGIYVGRPYSGYGVRRNVYPIGGAPLGGFIFPWPFYRDYYDNY